MWKNDCGWSLWLFFCGRSLVVGCGYCESRIDIDNGVNDDDGDNNSVGDGDNDSFGDGDDSDNSSVGDGDDGDHDSVGDGGNDSVGDLS